MKHEVSPVSLMGLEDFAGKRNEAGKAHIDTVSDISIELGVKLGKSSITLGDVKQLKVGDVLEVEKNLGHKVDVYLSNMKVGIGEAIVMDENSVLSFLKLKLIRTSGAYESAKSNAR